MHFLYFPKIFKDLAKDFVNNRHKLATTIWNIRGDYLGPSIGDKVICKIGRYDEFKGKVLSVDKGKNEILLECDGYKHNRLYPIESIIKINYTIMREIQIFNLRG